MSMANGTNAGRNKAVNATEAQRLYTQAVTADPAAMAAATTTIAIV